MPLKSIRAWLGIETPQEQEFAPLRQTLDALDHLEPDRARVLAAFAYLLGRVADADQHVSSAETRAMEGLVQEQGALTQDQAIASVAPAASPRFGSRVTLVGRRIPGSCGFDREAV